MLKNYLLIAVRHFNRHRGYAALNIAGLATGITCCLLIMLYVRDELRYDRFHSNLDRIFRVTASTSEDRLPTNANGAFPTGPALKHDFPEVSSYVRFRQMGQGEKRVVAFENKRFYESSFFFADSTLFDVFTFPLAAGDPKTALTGPFRIVITESTARKYFGDTHVLGRTLSIDAYNDGRFQEYEVTGIVRDIPPYSHLKFDFLASWSSQTDVADKGWWFEMVYTYVLLAPEASATRLRAALPGFMERHVGKDYWFSIDLQPVRDIHLYSSLRAELEPNGSSDYVVLFSAVAVFILLMACINFMNLATVQSFIRAREVGMRKVLGAHRLQLARQFLSESVVLSLLSLSIALVLVHVFIPVLERMAGREILLTTTDGIELSGIALGLALIVGVAAGSYPAFYLSRPGILDVLSRLTGGRHSASARLRKGLVVFQFVITTGLLVCTVVVYNQMKYLRDLNMGFAKEQVMVLPMNDEVRKQIKTIKTHLLANPNILGVTATEQVPARAGNGTGYTIEGKKEIEAFTRLWVDEDFNRTYGTELVAGRDFSASHPTDPERAYIVNESFVQGQGWPSAADAIGKQMRLEDGTQRPMGEIIGVVRNFRMSSLRESIYPVVLNLMPVEQLNFISINVRPDRFDKTLGFLRTAWNDFSPHYPFEYYFLDDDFERLHEADRRLANVFTAFSMVAILVACLGLFGLAAFSAERRTKEIGIRKVLGASIPVLLSLLTGEFFKLIAVAAVIALPVSYLLMNRWLQHFAVRTSISAGTLFLCFFVVFVIALATMSFRAIRAARADPARSLRYD